MTTEKKAENLPEHKVYFEQPGYIDIERMDKSLKSETFLMPSGLTREEVRQVFLNATQKERQRPSQGNKNNDK